MQTEPLPLTALPPRRFGFACAFRSSQEVQTSLNLRVPHLTDQPDEGIPLARSKGSLGNFLNLPGLTHWALSRKLSEPVQMPEESVDHVGAAPP